jgi:hypothetical protein
MYSYETESIKIAKRDYLNEGRSRNILDESYQTTASIKCTRLDDAGLLMFFLTNTPTARKSIH